ncbi:hypothetical protein LTR17_004894 [Elasticomyces elasticus]|nr:hypothetical protein LTR17_004894 [Elasticomyces elasticus]
MIPRPRPTRLPPGSDLFDDDEFGINFGLPLPRRHGPGLEGLLSDRGAMMLGIEGRGSVFDDLEDFNDWPPRRPGMMPGNADRGHLPDEFDDGDGFSDYRNDCPGRSGGEPRGQGSGHSGARQPYGGSGY